MKRLGKQRIECYQILGALNGAIDKPGWVNHPATKMWRGHGLSLIQYGIVMCREWIGRGYRDTTCEKIAGLVPLFRRETDDPPWLGNEAFHAAHRSNLLRKDPEWYSQYGWDERDDLPYVWPA